MNEKEAHLSRVVFYVMIALVMGYVVVNKPWAESKIYDQAFSDEDIQLAAGNFDLVADVVLRPNSISEVFITGEGKALATAKFFVMEVYKGDPELREVEVVYYGRNTPRFEKYKPFLVQAYLDQNGKYNNKIKETEMPKPINNQAWFEKMRAYFRATGDGSIQHEVDFWDNVNLK